MTFVVETEQLRVPVRENVGTIRLALRYRKLLALVALGAAAVCVVLAFVIPPTYTATIRLLPPQQNQSLASLFVGQTAAPLAALAQKDLGLKNPSDLYIGLLNSRSVQDALVRDFELRRVYGAARLSDARRELQSRTRIQSTKEGLITVSVEDQDPSRAAAIANGFSEELRAMSKRLAVTEAAQRRLFFDDQVQQAKSDLERAATEFTAIQQKTGVLQMDAQARVLIETAASLRAQIAAGEVRLHALRQFGTEQNPEIRSQEALVAGWRGELARLESQQPGDPAFSKGRAPEQAQEYGRCLRELRYREAVLEMLLKQSEAAKLDEAREGAVIQVVDEAVPPDRRSSPKRAAIVVVGTVLAVGLALTFLSLRQRYRASFEWQSFLRNLSEEFDS